MFLLVNNTKITYSYNTKLLLVKEVKHSMLFKNVSIKTRRQYGQ